MSGIVVVACDSIVLRPLLLFWYGSEQAPAPPIVPGPRTEEGKVRGRARACVALAAEPQPSLDSERLAGATVVAPHDAAWRLQVKTLKALATDETLFLFTFAHTNQTTLTLSAFQA